MKSKTFAACTALLTFFATALTADVVRLKNGDTLTGKITNRANGKVTLKGDLFGEITFNEADVVAFKVGENVSAAAPASGGSTANNSNFQGQKDNPQKPVWTRTLKVGGNYVSPTYIQGQIPNTPAGTTGAALGLPGKVLGVQASASFMRATLSDVHALDLAYNYVDYEPAGTQTDNYSATFMWNHKLSDRSYTVSRTSYSVDQIKNIDYSALQMFGVGYKVIDEQQLKFDIVPGLVALQEKKGTVNDGDLQVGGGFLQNLVFYPHAAASIEQRLLFRQSFEDSDVYLVDAYLGFKGMLSAKLGVSVGLTYTYDNSLGPVSFPFGGTTVTIDAQKKDSLTITSGFEYKF